MKLGGLSWSLLWLDWLVGPSRPTFVALWSAGVPAGSFSSPNQQVEDQFKLPRGVRKREWPIMWALRSETFGGKQGLTSRLSVWLQTQITSGYHHVTRSLNQGAGVKLDTTAFDARIWPAHTLYGTITSRGAQCKVVDEKGKFDNASTIDQLFVYVHKLIANVWEV